MKILVIGKNGQLGRSIHKLISNYDHHEFTLTGREELDLSSSESISKYFNTNSNFDVIINCAAYTSVDKAEEEAEIANQINHLAVKQIAEIANLQNTKLIHISTDYVFDGISHLAYLEDDKPNPINVYGKTKLEGERAIQNLMTNNATIIRTSSVYSEFGHNFVKTMMEYGRLKSEISVVSDQISSPTYAKDLAEAILKICDNRSFSQQSFTTSIFNFSNLGEISFYQFAQKIFDLTNLKCKVKPISSILYPMKAMRPRYTNLNKEKIINQYKINIPAWEDSLKEFLMKMSNISQN